MKKEKRILVVGSGGREAALVWKFAQSPYMKIFCAPGNAGISEYATCVPIKADDIDALHLFAATNDIDLTVVGPEAPLVAGIVDLFVKSGLVICGPSAAAARGEGSKIWFKELLNKYDIPTAPYEAVANMGSANSLAKRRNPQDIVIKADGLAGGKGVILPESERDVRDAIHDLMHPTNRKYGSADDQILIEDRLDGYEVSAMAITDGTTVYPFPLTQDYKRAYDGDEGENTGGMGAHTVSLPESLRNEINDLLKRVVGAFKEEGCPYRGFLYLGLMVTQDGPMVLECNCRLGDPETQVIMSVVDCDLAELCSAAAVGKLRAVERPKRTHDETDLEAVCIVLASEEYPGSSKRNVIINGSSNKFRAGKLFHASTAFSENFKYVTNSGGRVLNVVGTGFFYSVAVENAYNNVKNISFDGMRYRSDIGKI